MFAARHVTVDYAWTSDMRHYTNILMFTGPYNVVFLCFSSIYIYIHIYICMYINILSLIPSISMLSSRHRNLEHLPPDPLGRLNTLTRRVSMCHVMATTIKITLQGTNISPQNGILKMIFLFPRWDMLIPWRVVVDDFWFLLNQLFSWPGNK